VLHLNEHRVGLRSFHRGDWENALRYFQQVEPMEADILYYIGEVHRLKGDYDEAVNTFNLVIDQYSAFAPAYLSRARTRVALDPKAEVISDLDLAIQYDQSTFGTDPFEPQPEGIGSIFPLWVQAD